MFVGRQMALSRRLCAPAFALLVVGALAALSTPAARAAGPLTWSAPELVDHLRPYDTLYGLESVSCPSASLCVAVDDNGNVLSTTDPTGGVNAWTIGRVDFNNELTGVSCPSAALCVAVDDRGHVVTSTNPTGGAGAWTMADVDAQSSLSGVSCPSASLCVAVGAGGLAVTSTDPTAGAGGWVMHQIGANPLHGVSCPTVSLCVAVDDQGDVLTSTDPSAAVGTWGAARVDPDAQPSQCQGKYVQEPCPLTLEAVSCSSASLCVAVGDDARVVSSANPTGASRAWTPTIAPTGLSCSAVSSYECGPSAVDSVSCPTTSLCVAVDGLGDVDSSERPTVRGSWRGVGLDGGNTLTAVSCPSVRHCFAVDNAGNALATTDPTGGPGAWIVGHARRPPYYRSTALAGYIMTGLSCPSAALCVATDSDGDVIATTRPTEPGRAWRVAEIDPRVPDGLRGISCPSMSLCVAVDSEGKLFSSTHPADGARAWRRARIDASSLYIEGVSCPSVTLCVAVDAGGNVLSSTHPGGGARGWRVAHVAHASSLTGVSCPSKRLCLAVDNLGNVATSTDPTGGRGAWTIARVDRNASPNGLARIVCASVSLCVALDALGDEFSSTDPVGGADAWTMGNPDDETNSFFGLTGVACPSISLCVAVDGTGNVLLATPASLALAPTGAAATARELRLHFRPIGANPTNYTYTVSAPTGQTYQVGQIVSDGTRWIAFTTGQGQLRVYDSKTGRLSRPIAVDARCGPTALGSGLVLIACIAGAEAQLPVPAPQVLDLAHDTLRTVPGAFVGYDQPDAIGRYWIAEEFCSPVGMAGCSPFYVNWRTGRTVNPITDEIGPRPNLSSRTLAPLPRPAYSLRPCDDGTVFSDCNPSTPLRLLVPRHRAILLSRCSGAAGCAYPTLTPNAVTWDGLRDSYVYRIKDGARVTLTPSRSCGPDAGVSAIATLYQLVEVQCNGLYKARW